MTSTGGGGGQPSLSLGRWLPRARPSDLVSRGRVCQRTVGLSSRLAHPGVCASGYVERLGSFHDGCRHPGVGQWVGGDPPRQPAGSPNSMGSVRHTSPNPLGAHSHRPSVAPAVVPVLASGSIASMEGLLLSLVCVRPPCFDPRAASNTQEKIHYVNDRCTKEHVGTARNIGGRARGLLCHPRREAASAAHGAARHPLCVPG